MHDAGVRTGAMFFGQNAGHVVVSVPGVDDQRQASVARRRNVDAQRRLLRLGAVDGIMIIQTAFADPDHLGMIGQGNQLLKAGHRFFGDRHRVGAGGLEDQVVRLGNGADGGFVFQPGADSDHPVHANCSRAGDDAVAFAVEIREIEVAVAVGDQCRQGVVFPVVLRPSVSGKVGGASRLGGADDRVHAGFIGVFFPPRLSLGVASRRVDRQQKVQNQDRRV